MAPRAVGGALLALLLGCAPRLSIQADLGGDDLIAGVAIDDSGTVSSSFFGRGSDSDPFLRSVEEGAVSVGFFRWSRAALVGPEGEPLGDEVIDAAVVAKGLEGCGRCADPNATEIQLIVPGDLCGPPAFAEAEMMGEPLRGDVLESLRSRVAIAWPGECACPPTAVTLSEGSVLALEPRTVDPKVDAELYAHLLGREDGSITLFGTGQLLEISADGGRGRPTPLAEPTLAPDAALEIGDEYVLSFPAPAQESGGAVVRALVVQDRSGHERTRLDLDMDRVWQLVDVPSRGFFLVAGAAARTVFDPYRPSLKVCVLRDQLACAELAPNDVPRRDEVIRADVLPNGVVIGTLYSGRMIALERLPDPDEVTATVDGGVMLEDGSHLRARLLSPLGENSSGARAVVHEGRVFTCARAGTDSATLQFSVEPSLEVTNQRERRCPVAAEGTCLWLLRTSAGPRAWIRNVGLVDLSDQHWSEPCGITGDPSSLELEQLDQLISSSTGRIYALDNNGRWHESTDGSRTFTLRYGAREVRSIGAVAGSGDELWAISDNQVLLDSGTLEPHELELTESLPGRPRVAALEDELLVVGGDDPGTGNQGWLGRVSRSGEVLGTTPIPGRVRSIARLSAQQTLFVTEPVRSDGPEQTLFVDSDGRISSVALDWDDASTPEVEATPTGCARPLNRVAAAQGVGWVVGCGGAVFRVLPTRDGWRAERVPFVGVPLSLGRNREVETVQPLCADHAVVGLTSDASGVVALFELRGPDLVERRLPEPRTELVGGGAGIGLAVRGSEVVTLVDFGAIDRRSASAVARSAIGDSVRASVFAESFLGVVTEHGRVVRVELPN
ncbi:MAG: hypothetical protein HYV07_03420 [Deltaproteobacteria bacterium]|nr:hypothetical protein [Deltaproteobacteria bacterium]